MDTGTFSVIIFVLILIVGGYLILVDDVQGTPKTILIVVLVIITFFLIIKTGLFSSYNAILDSPVSATSAITPLSNYKYTASYSLSTWIYINDWNLYNGKPKHIISRTINNRPSPNIYLDSYENWLHIDFGTDPGTTQKITIKNINTQKWVNITCCFSNTNIDTYINGKLVDTTIPEHKLYYTTIGKDSASKAQLEIKICPNATGFSGFISNTNYYPYILTPQDAWNIYNKGYSSNMFGNLLNKYNASFTFYENQNEVTKFYIM